MMTKRSIQLPLAVAVGVSVLLPMAVLLVASLSKEWRFPNVMPQAIDLSAWNALFQGRLGGATLTSLWLALLSALISTVLGFPSGRALRSMGLRLSSFYATAILLPLFFPPIIFALEFQYFIERLGLGGQFEGVLLSHLSMTLPYAVLLSASFYSGFNFKLEQQARSLGATPFQAFWFIHFRALISGLVNVGVFTFLVSWSQYALTFQIGGGRVETLPLLIFSYLSGGNFQFGAAASLMFIIPTFGLLSFSNQTLKRLQA